MLPPRTDEEYGALKVDINRNGMLYPVIVDEDGLVLDGVHRCRIAAELGIDPPVSQTGHLDDDRKLHLAVGLNMRRRHLDADKRRDLVRQLHSEQGMPVRKISEIAGWSKSTIDRDLKTSPFEETLAHIAYGRGLIKEIPEGEPGREVLSAINDAFGALYGLADADWTAGRKRPDVVLARMTLSLYDMWNMVECLKARAKGEPLPATKSRKDGGWFVRGREWATLTDFWDSLDDEEREDWAAAGRKLGVFDRWERVPDGTAA
jgi:hypothetical protein